MANMNEGNVLTFRAAGAIGRFLRVKLDPDAGNGGARNATVSIAGMADRDIGTTEQQVFDAGHLIGVRVRNANGSRLMVASAAMPSGSACYTAAAGKVGPQTAGSSRAGTLLSAAAADNDIVEVLPDPGCYTPSPVAIADPGNAGAIPVTASGIVPLVTAGAETRTIASSTAIGLSLLLQFKTKVGNCVITVPSTINAAGNNTITLNAQGQSIELVSVTSGAGFRWAVKYNDGATLTTV